MKSLWNDSKASKFKNDLKQLRVYTSQLIGSDPNLVLHGGGNTSAKLKEKDFFGNDVDLLFVKGSGADLATIEANKFTSLRLEILLKLAELKNLTDAEMVTQQRCAMTDPYAPNTSVEAILHAIIPHRFVDHTHADSILAITNTENGDRRIKECFGDRIMVVPYVMPGLALARKVYEMTRGIDWDNFDGIVLLNHGLITFGDDAKTSYEATINLVTKAEKYLDEQNANNFAMPSSSAELDLQKLAELRSAISQTRGAAVVTKWDHRPNMVGYSQLQNIDDVGTRGPVTPDHSIRTKRIPMVWRGEASQAVADYAEQYQRYFDDNNQKGQTCLEPAPRWTIWPGHGLVSVGTSYQEASMVADIAEHTAKVVQQAEELGGWKALSAKEVFDVEYWELEQAKLKTNKAVLPLQGKIALVTGAASGIGLATVKRLHADGAAVFATDINPKVTTMFEPDDLVGAVCDVSDPQLIKETVEACVAKFGGLDIVVSNAGIFAQGSFIDQLDNEVWQRSLDLNLSQHKNLMQHSYPFLKLGIEPAFIAIGSKNVAAPGPGASAYSVAKAGTNQLMRVAALEWGSVGIRVNTIHPDCVFDTEIWAGGVLEQRAKKYEMTVEEYMSRNVLKTPVKSSEVACLVSTVASSTFAKTTGAQIPIDGGNDRVI